MNQGEFGLIVDCETTGLTESDEIVELALMQFRFDPESGEILEIAEKYSELRQPSVPTSPEAQLVHGISPHDLIGKSLNGSRIRKLFDSSNVVFAHNARFDKSFIGRLFPALPQRLWLCTLNDIDWEDLGIEARKLTSIAKHFNIQSAITHRALADAMTVLAILNKRDGSGRRLLSALLQHRQNLAKHFLVHSPEWATAVPLQVTGLHPSTIAKLESGDGVALWTKEQLNFINAYHFSSLPGGRPALRLLKHDNPKVTSCIDEDHDVSLSYADAKSNVVNLNVVRRVRPRYDSSSLDAYHRFRNENKKLTERAKSLEKTDAAEAIELYIKAIEQIGSYAALQFHTGLSQQLSEAHRAEFGVPGDIEILDRLTLTLCRAGRASEAVEVANKYFENYRPDVATSTGERVLKRVLRFSQKGRRK